MSQPSTHPSPEDLSAFSLGQLPPAAAAAVESHISECQPCCATLLGLSSDDTFVELLQEAEQLPTDQTVDQDGESLGRLSSQPGIPAALAEHPRYEILGLIGKGGMGDVYKARHRMMDRTVALKIINRELVRKAEAVDRFHREVKTAARLSHPNIVTAYDAEQAGDVHFLVMEYVDGVDLARTVKSQGALPIANACDYVRQAAVGLQSAHEMGMVHRDIKPHNLMVTADGTVKILDFGLASLASDVMADADTVEPQSDLTAVGAIMGTPDFISPEQADDAHRADIRSDIYSLGATLYFLLSGRPPFADGSVMHKLKSHAQFEPEPIQNIHTDVPDELAEVMRRMMAKDPAERFQTPAEVADALAPFVDRNRSHAPPPRKPVAQAVGGSDWQRFWQRLAVALISLVVGVGAAAVIYMQTDRGTVVIETEDENVELAVRPLLHESHEGAQHSLAWQYRIGDTLTGSSVKQLRSGAYIVDLQGRENEFELSQDRFVLRRGGKVVVRVRRLPANLALTDDTTPSVAPRLSEVLRFEGLPGFATSLDFAPDGLRLAAGGGVWAAGKKVPAQVMLWDARNGRRQREFQGHEASVLRVRFSPHGRYLASGDKSGVIVLLDGETLAEVRRLEGHTGEIQCLAFSPDGRLLASGSGNWNDNQTDVSLRVWDVETGEQLWRQDLPQSPDGGQVTGVAFSPDSAKLVSSHQRGDEPVTIWDARTGETLQRVKRLGRAVKSLAWSPDGRYLATGHEAVTVERNKWYDPENCVIRLYDAATGRELRVLKGHTATIDTLDFSPDSRLLVSGSSSQDLNKRERPSHDQSIRVWDVASGRELIRHELEKPLKCVRFSPDGTRIASVAGLIREQADLQLWQLPELETLNLERIADPYQEQLSGVHRAAAPVRVIPRGESITSLAYLPDGTIVTPSVDKSDEQWKLFFTSPSGEQMARPLPAATGIACLAAAPDGKWIATGSRSDRRVVLWDALRREPVKTWDAGGMVHSVAFSSDGNLLAAASWDGSAKVWNVQTQELVKELGGYGRVHRVLFSPDGKTLAVSETPSGRTDLYETSTWTKQAGFSNGYGVGELSFSADGTRIATGGNGLKGSEPWKMWVRVWDTSTGKKLMEFKEMQNAVAAVAISPDSRYLIAVGGNWGDDPNWGGQPHEADAVRVWDLGTQRLVAEFQAHDGWVRGVAFAPDGKHFATINKEVKVWDLEAIVNPLGDRAVSQ